MGACGLLNLMAEVVSLLAPRWKSDCPEPFGDEQEDAGTWAYVRFCVIKRNQ
jgi:hypothetical protein